MDAMEIIIILKMLASGEMAVLRLMTDAPQNHTDIIKSLSFHVYTCDTGFSVASAISDLVLRGYVDCINEEFVISDAGKMLLSKIDGGDDEGLHGMGAEKMQL